MIRVFALLLALLALAPCVKAADVVCGSAASSCVLATTNGSKLYSVYANCTAACWLMVFNADAAPVNGATTAGTAVGNLRECIPIAAGGAGSVTYSVQFPATFSEGIVAVISSTACATLTLSTVGFIRGTVQ